MVIVEQFCHFLAGLLGQMLGEHCLQARAADICSIVIKRNLHVMSRWRVGGVGQGIGRRK